MIIRIVFTKPLHRLDLGDLVLSGLSAGGCIFPFKYLVSGGEGATSLVLCEGFRMRIEEKLLTFTNERNFETYVSKAIVDHVEDLATEKRLYPETETPR